MECPFCSWRRRRIYDVDLPLDYCYCDSSHPAILQVFHSQPSDQWIDIINTDTLGIPEKPVERPKSSKMWVRIPLRTSEANQVMHWKDDGYKYESMWYEHNEAVVGFHNTPLAALTTPTVDWTGVEHGTGILKDQRLMYGKCEHNGLHGVNVYADGGCETFVGSGWVSLEVRCSGTTRLRGRREGRYCVCGPSAETCMNAVLLALWVPFEELPPLVFLTG